MYRHRPCDRVLLGIPEPICPLHPYRFTAQTLAIEFVNIVISQEQRAPIRFTFYWLETGRWEGRDFQVNVASSGG